MPTESTIEIQLGELAQIVEYVFRSHGVPGSVRIQPALDPWRGPVDSDDPFGGRLERSAGAGMRP